RATGADGVWCNPPAVDQNEGRLGTKPAERDGGGARREARRIVGDRHRVGVGHSDLLQQFRRGGLAGLVDRASVITNHRRSARLNRGFGGWNVRAGDDKFFELLGLLFLWFGAGGRGSSGSLRSRLGRTQEQGERKTPS